MLGDDQKAMREFLQHLRHECRRNTVLLGDLVGATSVLLAMHRQMLDGNQPVVGLFGKLEHRSTDFLDAKEYATESVAHGVYPYRCPQVNRNLSRPQYNPFIPFNLQYTNFVLTCYRISPTRLFPPQPPQIQT